LRNNKSVSQTKENLDRRGLTTKLHTSEAGVTRGGLPFRTGHLYTILRNPLYRGLVLHKGQIFDGDHEAVIDQGLWEQTQATLADNAVTRRSGTNAREPSLLAGILFDGTGNRLTPTHATKQGRRYRYYVSKGLIDQGRARQFGAERSLRLPAQEIERHVVDATAAFLCDPQRLAAEFEGGTAEQISTLVRQGSSAAKSLRGGDGHQWTRALLHRVVITEKELAIALDRRVLAGALNLPDDGDSAPRSVQLNLSVVLRRLGGERRMIVASGVSKSNPDPILIKVIVRAHKWFGMLKNHAVSSISQLAGVEKLPRTYIGSIIPLALLAPDIIAAIMEGRQPPGLTLDRLIAQPLPIAWSDQRALLGWVKPSPSSE
jgi:site-specific DNA recombinase